MTLEQRFYKHIDKTEQCWLWTGSKDRDGYGIFWLKPAKSVKAHRFAATLFGKDMSKPVVRHLCHNPACVNPDHLVTGTQKENIDDMIKAKRQKLGKGGRKKIAIISPLGYFESIAAAAQAYKVDTTTIRRKIHNQVDGWHRA